MNYIPPVQLRLEKGSIRDMCFHGVSCRNYSFEQCHCRDKLAGQGGSRGDLSHPWPAGPPQGPGKPPLQEEPVQTRQSQAGRAGSRERMLWNSPVYRLQL